MNQRKSLIIKLLFTFIILFMRFKALSNFAQLAMARAAVDLLKSAPSELMLPAFPVRDWLTAFRELNIKLGADCMPTSTALMSAVEYLESRLSGPFTGPFEGCGINF
jgi:hypothetical protein